MCIATALSPIDEATASARSSAMSETTTSAPSAAIAAAPARPIPEPPPTTSATFPSSLIRQILADGGVPGGGLSDGVPVHLDSEPRTVDRPPARAGRDRQRL